MPCLVSAVRQAASFRGPRLGRGPVVGCARDQQVPPSALYLTGPHHCCSPTRASTNHLTTAVVAAAPHQLLFSCFVSSLLAHTPTLCRTKLTSMTSAIAHPVVDLAHRDALDVRTHPEAALVAEEIATNTVAATAAHGRPTALRKVREATSLTVQVVELRRVQ
jgi:hypothetical protein